MKRWWVLMLIVAGSAVLMALWFSPAQAQGPEPESERLYPEEVYEITRELYCPLCAGLRVDVCELPVCDDMREIIVQKLEAGESKEEIKQYFYELYGPKVLGAPERRGVNWLVWVLPGVATVLALAGGVRWLRRHFAAGEEPEMPIIEIPAPYQARLERELRRFEQEG